MKTRFGISGPERMVVRIVGRCPGISAGALAGVLRVHPSTITWSLKRLTRRGLVARASDPLDARRALFTLTARGAAVDELKQGTVEAAVRSALEATPPAETRTTVAVLERLIRSLEAPAGAPGRGRAPGAAGGRVLRSARARR
jgi:DNA-binding MarR family transcriptional regulator